MKIIDFLIKLALSYIDIGSYLSIVFMIFITFSLGAAYILEKKEVGFRRKEVKRKASLTYMINENSSFINSLGKNSIKFFIFLSFYVFLIFLYASIEENYKAFFDGLLKVIIEFEGIFISFTALTITSLIFVITLTPKKYYLFFSNNDVFKKYHLGKFFAGICLTCLVTVIVSLLLLSTSLQENQGFLLMGIYFTMVILNLILDCFALIIIWYIVFNDSKFELKMLRKLNSIFDKNSKLFPIQTTDEYALYQNISFLLYDYQILVRNKKFKSIFNIKKASFCSINGNKIMHKKANSKFLCFFIALSFLSLLFSIISRRTPYFIIGNIVASVIFSLIIFYIRNKESIAKYIMNFVYPSSGYFFTLENKESEKFVGCYAMWKKNNFDKYILSCKNIMAFYCNICDTANSRIIEQKGDSVNISIIEELFKESLFALDENVKENEKYKDFIVKLPIILSSYFYYIKFNKIPRSVFLNEKNYTPKEIENMRTIIYSFILDISRFRALQKRKDDVIMTYKIVDLEQYINDSGFFESLFTLKNDEIKKKKKKK
ncbi:hypothetical protein [Anaerocolumna jejuensis]|uniref:hypothetical protein n=1 Tax=Anaerocolumna jejuensis TaxID=259063 RepID=UPI003F7C9A9A